MTKGRSRKKAKVAMPAIKGSTSNILCELFKLSAGVKKLSSDDPVLKMAVRLDAGLATVSNSLLSQKDQLNETNAAITAAITEIKSNPTTKQLGPSLEAEHTALAEKIPELTETRATITKDITSFSKEEQKIVMQLLRERSDGKKTPEEARKIIRELDERRVKINTRIQIYLKNNLQQQNKLNDLHERTYAAAAKKDAIPMPTKEIEKAQGASR